MASGPDTEIRHRIVPRRVRFDFSRVPKHWVAGRPFATHFIGALNLLFPAGERWFGRVCRSAAQQVNDPRLLAEVQGFAGQEATHARSHESFLEPLREQGFRIDSALEWLEAELERVHTNLSIPLQLAIIAGIEQFTAALGVWAFEGKLVRSADPAMRDLFLWHAAEEIEHKSVAFDLLTAIDSRYRVRLGGFVLACVALFIIWFWLTWMLILQDREASVSSVVRDLLRGWMNGDWPIVECVRAIAEYIRPGFHPTQNDDFQLAQAYLAGAPAVSRRIS